MGEGGSKEKRGQYLPCKKALQLEKGKKSQDRQKKKSVLRRYERKKKKGQNPPEV